MQTFAVCLDYTQIKDDRLQGMVIDLFHQFEGTGSVSIKLLQHNSIAFDNLISFMVNVTEIHFDFDYLDFSES